MNTNQGPKAKDTLDGTFASFFGESEETAGTGTVIRARDGILTTVLVDAEEHAAFHATQRELADAKNTEIDARHQAEAWYYAEEG